MQITARKKQIITFDQKVDLCNEKQNKNELIQMVLDTIGLNSTTQCKVNSSKVSCQTNKRILKYTKSLQMIFNLLEGDGKITYLKVIFNHGTGKSCFDIEHEISKN